MKVVYDRSEQIADHIYSYYFSAPQKPHYVAGQFTELRLLHDDKDSRGDRRWYTLSSSPTEDHLAITTKFAAQNGSSFKLALSRLQPGAELDFASPMGDFVLPKDPSIPLTFVAGGIGVTPFRSMLRLLYGTNREDEIAFRDELRSLGGSFKPVVAEPLSAGRILAEHGDGEGYIYLSGPEPMIAGLAGVKMPPLVV